MDQDGGEREASSMRVVRVSVFAVVAVVADVLAVAVTLGNTAVIGWLSRHPAFSVIALAALVLVSVGILALLVRARGEIRARETRIGELEARLKEPSSQDVQRYAEFQQQFGPKSKLYEWLKERFYTDKTMDWEVDALIDVIRAWDADPTTYHDEAVARAFDVLYINARSLRRHLGSNYWYADLDGEIGRRLLRIPIEWEGRDPERYKAACDAIDDALDSLMESYTQFVRVAHNKRLS